MWSFVGQAKEKVWIGIHEKFWESPLESEMQKGHEHYGIHCQRCIVNVQSVTQISGKLTRKCYPVNDIKLWGKRQA
jgi:hypothetical protein